jgi:hypothetical protein
MMKSQLLDWLDLADEKGRVDRPAKLPAWSAAPEVDLDDGWLLFRYPSRPDKRGLEHRQVKASADLLSDFVGLERAPAEVILKYARRHGRLGLCRHGNASHGLRIEGCRAAVCKTASGQMAVRESLDWWRTLAGHARALLSLAAQLLKGQVNDFTLGLVNPQLFLSASRLEAARRDPSSFVAFGAELWLRLFQVRPRISYNIQRKRFESRINGAPSLPGALALQIMLTITRSAGIAMCSSCGNPYSPSRRPNLKRNAYCQSCGIRGAWRDAQAHRRAKLKKPQSQPKRKRRSP